MAGDSVIGALRVVLGLDTASFEDGAKRASSSAESFGRRIAEVAGGVQLQKTVEQLTKAFINLAKSGLETADQIGKMSQKIGIPVENLSKLSYVAQLSDVSLEELGKSVVKLSKNMASASGDAINETAAAFQYLGIRVKDSNGGLKASEQIMLEVADKFAAMEDGANKTALAVAIFGRAGANLIPLLNQGAEGIRKVSEQASGLGLVISTETAAAAEKFQDNMKGVGSIAKGVALQLTAQFAPALADISQRLLDWAIKNQVVQKTADVLARAILFVSDNLRVLGNLLAIFIGAKIAATIIQMGIAFIAFARAINLTTLALTLFNTVKKFSLATFLALGGIIAYATGTLPGFTKALQGLGDALGQILPEDIGEQAKKLLEGLGLKTTALTDEITGLGSASDDTAEKLKKMADKKPFTLEDAQRAKAFADEIKKLSINAKENRGEFDHLAPGLADAAIRLKLVKDNGQSLTQTLANLPPKVQALNAAFVEFKASEIIKAAQTEWEKYNEELGIIAQRQKQVGIGAQEMAKLQEIAALKVATMWANATSDIATNIASGLKAFAQQNKQFAAAAKIAAIGQAIANTAVAITKTLAQYGWTPIGIAAMAAATFAGAAQIATIRAQEFASGGSFKVPGGISGVDTTMIPLNLAAGERVDITPASEVRGRGAPREINLTGIRPRDLFTGEMVRHMFDTLNRGFADGYRLKVVE